MRLVVSASAILMLLFADFARAEFSLELNGGYLNSRVEHAATSSFTLLANGGTFGRVETALGGKTIDVFLRGHMIQGEYEAPASRTINDPEVQSLNYMGAFRWKNPYVWVHMGYESKELIYLIDKGSSVYDLKLARSPLGVFGLTFFGWGKGYRLTLGAEGGVAAGSGSTSAGTLEHTYMTRGSAKVEFGGTFRIGLVAGIENQEYKLGETKYHHSDFMVGLTLIFGGGGGKKSGSSGRSYEGSIPNFPL